MRYALAIFDFDGTLADSITAFVAAVNDLADRHAFRRIEERELDTLRGYDARRMRAHLGIAAWKAPVIAAQMRSAMAGHLHRVRLFDGIDRALRLLAGRGVTLAIATSNSESNVRQVLGPELSALFRHVECGAALFGKAPRYRRILAASGVPAARAISIGDEIRDHDASRRAGIAFGAVAWGYTRVDTLAAGAPDEMFATVDEMIERIAGPASITSDA